MAVPITDAKHAVDCVLDARYDLAHVRDSDLPGGQLYLAAARAVDEVDKLLRLVRALATKEKS